LGTAYELIPVGPVEIKGKGLMETYLVARESGSGRTEDGMTAEPGMATRPGADNAIDSRQRPAAASSSHSYASGRRNGRRPATTQPTPIPTA
jgi:hypothetical protein